MHPKASPDDPAEVARDRWRFRAPRVNQRERGLRWDIEALKTGEKVAVVADTTESGRVLDLQGPESIGTTGDAELDHEVCEYIADVFALRDCLRQLDELERPRTRSDRLRRAA